MNDDPRYGNRGYPPQRPFPGAGPSAMVPVGTARQARHASAGPVDLGDERDWDRDPLVLDPAYRNYTKVPAYYVVTAQLGGEDGDSVRAITQLRPEPFVLRRITWATTGDLLQQGQDEGEYFPFGSWTQQGRSVRVRWGDSFTTFLGVNAALVSALFGDSNGFLDVPGTALFQGSQNLEVELTRVQWPFVNSVVPDPERFITRWDFVFAGVSLLPAGVNQSGSVG